MPLTARHCRKTAKRLSEKSLREGSSFVPARLEPGLPHVAGRTRGVISRCLGRYRLQAMNLLEKRLRRHGVAQEILHQGTGVPLRAIAQQLCGKPPKPAGISSIESSQFL